jgi:hypothetical protein
MKRLLLSLLIVSLFSAVVGLPAAFGQSCATPPPTYTPTPGYRATLQAVAPSNLIVYLPLNETSGTVAEDDSGNNADGTYHGVTLNTTTFLTGDPAGTFDGVNDYVDALTSYLISHFSGSEGSIQFWAKVDAAFWVNNIISVFAFLSVDANNLIRVRKTGTNLLNWTHIAGAVARAINETPTPTVWTQYVFTWSNSLNRVAMYRAGALVATVAAPGTWAGSLANAFFGATVGGASAIPGNMAQIAIWNAALDSTKVAVLATIDPTQIVPPTATLCPTYTPTPSPTWTPTYTPTPTNTPNLYHFWTLPAPIGTPLPDATGTATPAPGQDVVFVSEMNAGQVGISFLLAAIFFSLLIMWLVVVLMRRKAPKQPKPVITTNQSE